MGASASTAGKIDQSVTKAPAVAAPPVSQPVHLSTGPGVEGYTGKHMSPLVIMLVVVLLIVVAMLVVHKSKTGKWVGHSQSVSPARVQSAFAPLP